jgi:hypothetical protein
MALPYQVESLDDVPETVRELYEETDGGFRLPVEGVKAESEIAGLESALEKLKRERKDLKAKADRVSDDDIEELERLRQQIREKEEQKATEEGRLDEIRAKWQEEEKKKLAEKDKLLASKDAMIRDLAVTSQLRAAIAEAGVLVEFQDDARRALMERGPQVKIDGERPVGVFPDEVHGDKPISDFVKEWAKSDEAKKYMPAPKGGGGGTGRDGQLPQSNKKYSEMTPDEKVAYTESKYASV